MRAVVYDRYGPPDVQRLEKVERPVPRDDQVLIKIHATTAAGDRLRTEGHRAHGPLHPLLQAGLAVHAQIFELYAQDSLIAFDPQYPGYAPYHAAYTRAIDSAAAVVGTAR